MMRLVILIPTYNEASTIAELLSETNEILTDMPFIEANQKTGHRTTVRTGYPDVIWSKFKYLGDPCSITINLLAWRMEEIL